MTTGKQFWMVYGLDAGPPRHRHDTEASALREAERLAKLAPGTVFVVLAATHAVVRRDVIVRHLGSSNAWSVSADPHDDDIPF